MSLYYVIYHGLILIALVLAIICYRTRSRKYILLAILLTATLFVELMAEVLYDKHQPFVWAYHGFVVLEYSLLCLYYLQSIGVTYARFAVRLSMPLFFVLSLGLSYFFYGFVSFPGLNIDIEGFLLFLLFTHLLFNLRDPEETSIYSHPDFWMALGPMVFFGGTFLFNGVYTRLFQMDRSKALELFGIINRPLNIFLYGSLITGLLCSIRKTKSISP